MNSAGFSTARIHQRGRESCAPSTSSSAPPERDRDRAPGFLPCLKDICLEEISRIRNVSSRWSVHDVDGYCFSSPDGAEDPSKPTVFGIIAVYLLGTSLRSCSEQAVLATTTLPGASYFADMYVSP